ncbi:hypothetical protein D3C85_1431840 [compost metagenome]
MFIRPMSSSSRSASSVAMALRSDWLRAPLPACPANSRTRCSRVFTEFSVASSWLRLFCAAVRLPWYWASTACCWSSCSRRTEATGSSAGVRMRLPVLICSWVRATSEKLRCSPFTPLLKAWRVEIRMAMAR